MHAAVQLTGAQKIVSVYCLSNPFLPYAQLLLGPAERGGQETCRPKGTLRYRV